MKRNCCIMPCGIVLYRRKLRKKEVKTADLIPMDATVAKYDKVTADLVDDNDSDPKYQRSYKGGTVKANSSFPLTLELWS